MEFAKRFSIAVRCLIAYNIVYGIAIRPDSQTIIGIIINAILLVLICASAIYSRTALKDAENLDDFVSKHERNIALVDVDVSMLKRRIEALETRINELESAKNIDDFQEKQMKDGKL